MSILKFKDGTEVETLRVMGGKTHLDNASRDELKFTFDLTATVTFDSLRVLFENKEITSELKIVDGATENVYSNYTLVTVREISKEVVTPETPESPAVYKDIITFGLAQLTYAEKTIAKLAEALPVAFVPTTLEELKQAKCDSINASCAQGIIGGFQFDGKTFPSDLYDQVNMMGAVDAFALMPVIPWNTLEDGNGGYPLTLEKYEGLKTAFLIHRMTLQGHVNELKALVALATSAEELDAIIW